MVKASLNLARVGFLFLALLALTNNVYALPFTIIPKAGTSLPTVVTPGGSVTAYYTVSNNTSSQRNNNFVKYLPPNTVQVVSGGSFPNACGAQFNLSAVGKPGSSCTLQLKVSGPVNGNDPNPHHHLFVCFPGGTTCAGTNFPLNVVSQQKTMTNLVISPSTATLAIGMTQQFTATAIFNDGSIQNVTSTATWNSSNPGIASISASGLVTALLVGSTNITATFNAFTSNPATVTVSAALLQSINITPTTSTIIAGRDQQYTAIGQFSDGSSQNITGSATWNSSNPTIASIAPGGLAAGLATGTTNIRASLNSVTSNIALLNVRTIAYVLDGIGNQVLNCPVNSNGTFGACNIAQSGFSGPIFMRLNINGTFLYVVNINDSVNSFVNFCPVSPDGSLGPCTTTASGFSAAVNIAFNPTGTKAYIASTAGNIVTVCTVLPDGRLSPCAPTGGPFDGPVGIKINAAGTRAYITNEDTGFVSLCPINNNGTLGTCINANMPPAFPFVGPHSVTFNATETRAYITNFDNDTISMCNVTNAGRFTGCTVLPNAFPVGPNDMVFTHDFTKAYVVGFLSSTILVCNVNNNTGALNPCVNAGGNGYQLPGTIVLP